VVNLIRPRRGQHRVAGFDEQAVWRETAITTSVATVVSY
jgi:hypothetical protein